MDKQIIPLQEELTRLLTELAPGDGVHETAMPHLKLARMATPTTQIHSVQVPALCVVVQGRKRVFLNDEIYEYSPSHYLIAALDLPITGQITHATQDIPYLSLRIDIDMAHLRELIVQSPVVALPKTTLSRALFLSETEADPGLMETVVRLVRLLKSPKDIAALSPLIMQEIYYRLLNDRHGEALRQMALSGSQAQKIANVIERIKADYTKPIRISDLADEANMSVSALHAHFRAMTAMSPLQFQKKLRLQEARHRLLTRTADAAHVAFEVGYESASQFSREYSRLFGLPPISDIKRLAN